MSYFSKDILMSVANSRGYLTERATAFGISTALGIKQNVAKQKLRSGRFTLEESMVIGSYFEMTPKEFCDVFLNGLFEENSVGVFICTVENPKELLASAKNVPRRPTKAEKAEMIVREIESL